MKLLTAVVAVIVAFVLGAALAYAGYVSYSSDAEYRINSLKHKVVTLTEELSEMQEKLKMSNETIRKLTNEVGELRSRLEESEAKIADYEKKIEELSSENEELRNRVKELESEIDNFTKPKRVKLWRFDDVPSSDYWRTYMKEFAKALDNYIMPDNVVVRAFAEKVELEKECDWYFLVYKNGSYVKIKYMLDTEQFGRREMPVNPDYFLTHGMKGDCEDIALAMASVLMAKGYDVKVAFGKVEGAVPPPGFSWIGHVWVEVTIDGKTYIGDLTTDGRYALVPKDELKNYIAVAYLS